MTCLLTQPQQKITTKLQNNYHPESSENQAVWKSDNQGIKEVTFIQTCRRGGDMETSREVETWNGLSHIHMWWVEIGRDTSGVRGPSSGLHCQEDMFP